MKDWQFYPLIALAAALMIVFALFLGRGETIDTSQGLTVQGQDLSRLVVAPGHTLEMSGTSTPIFATLRSHALRKDAPSAGVFLALSQEYQDAYDGQDIDFSIRARTTRKNGVASFRAGFFAPGGSTSWTEYALTSEFEDFSFSFRPKQIETGEDYFYFGIWADWDGLGAGLDVSEMSVRPADTDDN